MSISGFFQFILGFFLGICILSGSAVGMAYYLFTKMTVVPTKPIFPEEKTREISAKKTTEIDRKNTSAFNKTDNEANGYRAKVIWPQGLILRAQATTQSARLGAIAYNSEIIVIEESQDREWQKIRELQTNRKGWIKSGNIEKINP